MMRPTLWLLSLLALLILNDAFAYTTQVYSSTQRRMLNTPNISDRMIEARITNKKFKEALELVDARLAHDPNNTELLYQKALIYAELELYLKAIQPINQILAMDPHDAKTLKLKNQVLAQIAKLPKNEIGFGQDESYVSDLQGYWSYSSIHYYRFTQYGIFGARLNYANRYGQGGEQYVVEAYPAYKDFYLNAIFRWSNTSQRVFPQYSYVFEPYINLPHNLLGSLGIWGIHAYDVNIHTYTGSLGVYFDNYFLWVRPSHYTPSGTNYFEVGLQRYFSDKNHYITLKVGAGRYPDIGDVPPFNQISIFKATFIGIDGQTSIAKNTFIRGRLGFTRQVLPAGNVRRITDGGGEIIWRF